jgi:hypothetical protein
MEAGICFKSQLSCVAPRKWSRRELYEIRDWIRDWILNRFKIRDWIYRFALAPTLTFVRHDNDMLF